MKSLALNLLVLLLCTSLHAQNVFIGKQVGLPSDKTLLDNLTELDYLFSEYTIYEIDVESIFNHIKKDGSYNDITLKLGNDYEWSFSIYLDDVRSENFVMNIPVLDFQVSTYLGFSSKKITDVVYMSIRKNHLSGGYNNNGEMIYFEPLHNIIKGITYNLIIVYKGKNVLKNASCGANEVEQAKKNLKNPVNKGVNCREAEIAIAATKDFVDLYGGVAGALTEVTDRLNGVRALYNPPPIEIDYKLVEFWPAIGANNITPSSESNINNILDDFQTWGNGGGFSVTYDVATLWLNRATSPSDGLARIGAVCTSNRYNAISSLDIVTRSTQVALQAHELGHNWSANHGALNTINIMSPTVYATNNQWTTTSENSIINHKNSRTCLGACSLTPMVDFIADNLLTCDGEVQFTDLSTRNPTGWLWDFGDGNTSAQQNPLHTYSAPGVYTVTLTASNVDGYDSDLKTNYIHYIAPGTTITTTGDTICGSGKVTLSASGNVNWFTSPTGGSSIKSGATYTTPVLTNTTTYYVEPVVGGVSPTTTGGSSSTNAWSDWTGIGYMHTFDALQDMRLVSLMIRVFQSSQNGTREITLLDATGNIIKQMTTGNLTTAQQNNTIVLNWDIPAGNNYKIGITGGTAARTAGTNPYQGPFLVSGLINIKTHDNISGGKGLSFYDWVVQPFTCTGGERIPVTAGILPLPNVNAGVDISICNGTSTDLSATGATTYSWNNGVPSGAGPHTVTPNSTTIYTVTGTASNGCIDTDDVTVTVNSLPVLTSVNDTTCSGRSLNLTVSGAKSYVWSPGTNLDNPNVASPTFTSSIPGNYSYTITGTGINGCVGTTTLVATVDSNPCLHVVTIADTIICEGESATLRAIITDGGPAPFTTTWDNGVPSGAGPHTVSPTATTTYTATVSDQNGRTVVASATITVNPLPLANAGTPKELNCANPTITLNGSTTSVGSVYNWSGPGIISGGNTLTPIVNTAGAYTITITSNKGCVNTGQVTVTENKKAPNVSAGSAGELTCKMPQITLGGSSSTMGATYNWSGSGVVSGKTTLTPIVNVAGVYTLTVTDPSNGCTSTDQVTITENKVFPTVNAGSDMTICSGDPVTLTASGTATTYSWNNGVVDGVPFNPISTKKYTLTGVNAINGCSSTSSVSIAVLKCSPPTASFVLPKSTLCLGECISIQNNSGGIPTPTYIWLFTGADSSNSVSVNPESICWNNVPGTYTVTLLAANILGTDTITKTIKINEIPVVKASPDAYIIAGTDVDLSATVSSLSGVFLNGTYSWTPDTYLRCSNCQYTTALEVGDTIIYTVTYEDEAGCKGTDQVAVYAEIVYEYGVPTGFSPNGDGSNDVLFVEGNHLFTSILFTIYNRYGQKVFETIDPKEGWDGTHNGKLLNPGVFAYRLNVSLNNGVYRETSGNVTLIK